MNRVTRFAAICSVSLLVGAVPVAAHATSYLDEVVQALQHEHVYVAQGAKNIVDSNTESQLEAQITSSDIGIAVLPASADQVDDPSQLLGDIADQTGYTVVVVAYGNDLHAGSSVLPAGEAARLADNAEADAAAHGGTTGDALLDFVAEVNTALVQNDPPPIEQQPQGQDSGGFPAGTIVLVGLAVVAAGAGVRYFLRRMRPTRPLDKALARMRSFAGQIQDIGLRSAALAAADHTDGLIAEFTGAFPNRVRDVRGTYAVYAGNLNQLLEGYVRVQNKPYSASETESFKIRQSTQEGISAYESKVRQGFALAREDENDKFYIALEMLKADADA